eukprot:CAMPEP_0176486694 /NCGR_PEP_ID=MMETSP0200_2-20121128/5707_1 /TAXON_ID=947934 /ORGANISM="Chaetoceros sp., Strain GSL56" /LENGTH=980 /DNA_ID=CAMNT_0017883417 /DNA_START=250 /DNA_END=3192 /DNA_ORIENTATION=-
MGNTSSQTKPIQGHVTEIYPIYEAQKSNDADVCKTTKNRVQVAREMNIRRKRGIKVELRSKRSPVPDNESPETFVVSTTTPEERKLQDELMVQSTNQTEEDVRQQAVVNSTVQSENVTNASTTVNSSAPSRCKDEEESPKSVVDTACMIENNFIQPNLELPCHEMNVDESKTTTPYNCTPNGTAVVKSQTVESNKTQCIANDLHQGFIALEKEWKKSATVVQKEDAFDVDQIVHPLDLAHYDESPNQMMEDEESIGSIDNDDDNSNLLFDFDKPERCDELDELRRIVEEIDSRDVSSQSLFEITPILEEQEDESDEDKSIPESANVKNDSKRFIHDLHAGVMEDDWNGSLSRCNQLDYIPLSPPRPRRLFGRLKREEKEDDELSFESDDDDYDGILNKTEKCNEANNCDQHLSNNVNTLDFEFDQMMNEFEEEENLDAIKRHNVSTCDTPTQPEDADDKSIGSNSMFSQSDSSGYQSLGPYSTAGRSSMGFSMCDISISQSTADIMVERNENLCSNGLNKNGSQSNSFKKYKSTKPSADNAFETLPRHLIKTSLIQQAVATLRDERFLSRRISKLGAVYAAKVQVLDFICLDHKITKDIKKIETERTSLEASMPSTAYFANGEDFDSIAIDSFEIFEKCVLELCGIQMIGFDVFVTEDNRKSNEENMLNGKSHSGCGKFQLHSAGLQTIEPKILLSEGGRALYAIGKYCQKQDWEQDAMEFFKHALYLCFLDVGVEEPRLLDNSDDCDGFFYVQLARGYFHRVSDTYKYIASILTKMGDIHGKCDEKNDALRAYKASEVFIRKFISDLSLERIDDNQKRAAVEALALSFNRVGAVYTAKGELDAALSSFHEALDMQSNTLGEDHIEVAKTLHNIGVCHRHKDDWDSALNFYIKAHRIFEKNLGRDHLDTVRTLHNIGGVYRRKKDYSKAMECFKEVLVVRRNALGDDHPSVSITLVSMAAVLRRSGKKKEANKFYAAAVR